MKSFVAVLLAFSVFIALANGCEDLWEGREDETAELCAYAAKKGRCSGSGNGAGKAQKMCPQTCGLCDDMRAADRQLNCDEGGKCESAIAKRLKRCVSEGFPDGGKSDLQWGSQLLHCTKARLMWGGDSKAACLPCICDYVQANMPDSAKWDDYTENFCSKHA